MAKGKIDTIQLATGPYVVTRKNALQIAERIKYRHYKPDELELAKDFVRQALLPGKYYFDYYLMTEAAKKIWEEQAPPTLSDVVPWCMRVDAVVFIGRKVWLLEFKERLRPSGVGQLLTYERLWKEQYGGGKPVLLGYVARVDNADMHSTLEEKGIRWWIVPK